MIFSLSKSEFLATVLCVLLLLTEKSNFIWQFFPQVMCDQGWHNRQDSFLKSKYFFTLKERTQNLVNFF